MRKCTFAARLHNPMGHIWSCRPGLLNNVGSIMLVSGRARETFSTLFFIHTANPSEADLKLRLKIIGRFCFMELQRRRLACASAQTDQRLCYSLESKIAWYTQGFNILASLCSSVGWNEYCLVANNDDMFFKYCKFENFREEFIFAKLRGFAK